MKRQFLRLLILLSFFTGCCGIAAAAGDTINLEKIQDISLPLKTSSPENAVLSPVQPQIMDFQNCFKYFNFDSQKLFYLTLAGVNANRFKILEIQSKSGYIIFLAAQREFLATVININAKSSMLKITPCNNIYYFPAGIIQNMFKYIELNTNTPIEKINP